MGERSSGKAFGAKTLRLILRFSALLNKVWGLEGCPLKGQLMLMNRSVRFGFGGSTVLSALVVGKCRLTRQLVVVGGVKLKLCTFGVAK